MKIIILNIVLLLCCSISSAQNVGFFAEGNCYSYESQKDLTIDEYVASILIDSEAGKLSELSEFKLAFSEDLGYAIQANSIYLGTEKQVAFSFGHGTSFVLDGTSKRKKSLKEMVGEKSALTNILATVGGNIEFVIRNFFKDLNYTRAIVEGEKSVITYEDKELILKVYHDIVYSHYIVTKDDSPLISWQVVKDENGFLDSMKLMYTKEVLAGAPEISEADLDQAVKDHLSSDYYRDRLAEFRKFYEINAGTSQQICVYSKFEELGVSKFNNILKSMTNE